MPLDEGVPSRRKRSTLNDPENCQNDITDDQDSNRDLKWSDEVSLDRYTQQEKTDRDLGEHQSLKGLHPFAVRVFLKFNVVPC